VTVFIGILLHGFGLLLIVGVALVFVLVVS